ncbi:CDP-archaeol synthase [Candidatus Woesearchaeota archaeon]|nr:CDP-archaeol synthase [Candidatus Woesearchaeota archaeon]
MVIIEELYFALPIYVSNMSPVFARRINFLNYPINEKLFGSHKTYRGLVSGILASIIFFYIQLYLYRFNAIKSISLINYNEINVLLIGFLAGFGVITGDLIKSYFKRRKNIKPGKSWIPFDQLDFILGALIVLYPFIKLSLKSILILIVLTPFLHVGANHVAYYIKLRKEKW